MARHQNNRDCFSSKRTARLAREEAIVIDRTPDGQPIFTTAGELAMSPEDKANLSLNLAAHNKRVYVEKIVKSVQQQFAQWFEISILNLAPTLVAGAYMAGDTAQFEAWLTEQPLKCVTDGLTATILRNGEELASTSATVDPLVEHDVLMVLKMDKVMVQGGL